MRLQVATIKKASCAKNCRIASAASRKSCFVLQYDKMNLQGGKNHESDKSAGSFIQDSIIGYMYSKVFKLGLNNTNFKFKANILSLLPIATYLGRPYSAENKQNINTQFDFVNSTQHFRDWTGNIFDFRFILMYLGDESL